ncbi:unnamed protein product [Mucor hiemalis]
MHFNIGSIFTILNDHRRAIAAFNLAILKDPHFAVAYFQRGVSFFLLGDLLSAEKDFDRALQKLRGNPLVNYEQLGLHFCLYECEVLFNRGICQLNSGKIDSGLTDLYHAQKAKVTDEHDLIDHALQVQGKDYSVYSMPPGLLFRPSELRLRQLRGMNIFRDKCPSFTNADKKIPTFIYQQGTSLSLRSSPSPLSSRSTEGSLEETDSVHCQYSTKTSSSNSSSSSQSSLHSLKKLKIKCHSTDTRILLASVDINFQDLKIKISEKFDTDPDAIQLSYEDEEQERVLIVDDEDLEMARQINQAKSLMHHTSVEKLEVWL